MFYITVFVVVITLFFPEIKAALTEIDSDRYVEVDQISAQIKNEKTDKAKKIRTLITNSLENNKITVREYKNIKEAVEYYELQTQKIDKDGIKK